MQGISRRFVFVVAVLAALSGCVTTGGARADAEGVSDLADGGYVRKEDGHLVIARKPPARW